MGEYPNKETQFKPGQSGNPAGKKPGTKSITTLLKKILHVELDTTDPVTKEKCKKSISEIIGLRLASQAMSGNIKAIKIILDRVEGRVADSQEGQEDWIGEQLQIIVNEAEAKEKAEQYLQ